MKMTLFLSLLLALIFSLKAFGYGVGVSTFPIEKKTGTFTMEYVGFVSGGKGDGFQARYTRKMNSLVAVEGGVGISDSALNKRIFAAADIEFLPDYGKQPRFSLRPFIQSAEEFETRRNIIGVAPLISKGFLVGSKKFYPFIGMPSGLVLNNDTKQYEVRTQVSAGVTAKLPGGNFENVIANLEGNFNIQNSYSAVYFGLSFPFI